MRVILGSKSPRRQALLRQMGIEFQCITSDKEEVITRTDPEGVVAELSRMKGVDVEQKIPKAELDAGEELLIIAADTIVAFGGRILGKPADKKEAFYTLRELQGHTHQVYTGVSIIYRKGSERKELVFYEKTDVTVKRMEDDEIIRYIQTGEPMDKAGSYGIQGKFGIYIGKIQGDYQNVVGLPIAKIDTKVREELNINLMTGRHLTKAVILDLDGTTLDTVESIATTANQALHAFGLKQHPLEAYKEYAGDGQEELIRRALYASGDRAMKHFPEVMERYIELFQTGCMYHVKAYDGIKEVLSELKKKKIKLCILSNKAHANTCSAVNAIFGEGFFDVVLGHKPEFRKKPDIDGLLMIMGELRVRPEECLYIGDTSTDMKTGTAAGIYTIGVTWGFRQERELTEFGADRIIHDPHDILGIICV